MTDQTLHHRRGAPLRSAMPCYETPLLLGVVLVTALIVIGFVAFYISTHIPG